MFIKLQGQPDPTLIIKPADDVTKGFVDKRGFINTNYTFNLLADNIPSDLTEVTFSLDTSGLFGGPFSVAVNVSDDGTANTTFQVSYPDAGNFTIDADVLDGSNNVVAAANPIEVVVDAPTLGIDPPGLDDGEVNETYTFTFNADHIPTRVDEVVFTYSFGDGSSSAGKSGTITVNNGKASFSANKTYAKNNSYGLVVTVADASTGDDLADATELVTIGSSTERNQTLNECECWERAGNGGLGGTIDKWDISAIPAGASFSISYVAQQIPDRFIVDYPVGNEVFDSGWRGNSTTYNGNPLYPGGIEGPGGGEAIGIFAKLSVDEFQVTAIGPGEGTIWDYQISCCRPGSVCTVPKDDVVCLASIGFDDDLPEQIEKEQEAADGEEV